ncbi:type IV pilin N-terminal domain-containing protein [Natribaculum luteum]|uniref:Type IV pilin N-terminal domain-containing protein n=1 Tax=Natribaculum luteum TaxID=1586232 RepID=A0ABD5P2L1_9EURY
MVAITVILAAVIAAFVLDLGQGQQDNARAGVQVDVSDSAKEVQISVTSLDNAEEVLIRGDVGEWDVPAGGGSGSFADAEPSLSTTGASTTLEWESTGSRTDGEVYLSSNSGTLSVVGVTDDGTETTIQTVDYDFS